ncbi:hypothetical protein SAMN05444062_101411 [Pseudomonas syringae]|jgi:hypothetical protein|uniref:Uncharacterized protein n=2 Tax=Pseudomonas syringae TaxID=317 RepID=A0AB38BMR1_PSESX|nr:hypothetical protein [Pseudomonas syringae]SFG78635.1 hypothetical protein SAMN05444062_101411 [Pseudomonas syringae]SFN57548.1 hypothetical protein SAMN05444065_101267 [Pseudomonas syringae]SFO40791.1 hypothetical protein SAMN05444063_105267 [Pseudomonas syringae]
MAITTFISDPLQPLLDEADSRRIQADDYRDITWVIDQEWVTYHGDDSWSIGPDEPASGDQVRDLLVSSDRIYELQDY